jgi:hypothetical protein
MSIAAISQQYKAENTQKTVNHSPKRRAKLSAYKQPDISYFGTSTNIIRFPVNLPWRSIFTVFSNDWTIWSNIS